MILVHTVGIQSVQMLTGSQLSVLQKARTEGGLLPVNALHTATLAQVFSPLFFVNFPF